MTRNEFIALYVISMHDPQRGGIPLAVHAANDLEVAGVAPWVEQRPNPNS